MWVEAQSYALRSPDSVQKLVADARAAGFDTLFVQVRRNGDALYRSQIVPADPGLPKDFDPLGFLIRQCRTGGRPLKVHGVLTMGRVWSNADGTPPDNHVAKQHAEWLTRQPDGKAEFGAGAGELCGCEEPQGLRPVRPLRHRLTGRRDDSQRHDQDAQVRVHPRGISEREVGKVQQPVAQQVAVLAEEPFVPGHAGQL